MLSPPEQVRVVRRYLSTVDALKPGRGQKRAAEAVANRLLKIDELLISADPISRLHLTQERIDLDAEYMRLGNGNSDAARELREVERDFVTVARAYGERTGITYAAWRQVGVEADVLERAGITRVRKPGHPNAGAGAPGPNAGTGAPATAPDPAKQAPPVPTQPPPRPKQEALPRPKQEAQPKKAAPAAKSASSKKAAAKKPAPAKRPAAKKG